MKISVVTIVYNNKESIATCVESVLNQTYPDVEHIIVDGASTDGTQEVVQSYGPRVAKFVSEKDKGLYNALNKGLQMATGDIIGILHSDDLYFENTTLEDVANCFMETQADLVYGNGVYVDKQDISRVKRIYPAKPFSNRFLKYGWIPLHTTIYVKKEVFKEYGMYDESYKIASDYEISLRWFLEDKIKKYYLNQFLVKMRLGGKSTTAKLQKLKSKEDFKIIKQYNLLGFFTLGFKIARKIPQYIKPRLGMRNF
ncbi:MAG: glycosyl transferase [Cytophagaceae bacterium]|nr:glycosyl transferase [Cytophagaceae bacterium]